MHQITKRFTFDAAHRLLGHEGKCRFLHGHTYIAEVTVGVEGDQLDSLGRVLDFGVLKSVIKEAWIDVNWDHNILLHPSDPLLRMVKEAADLGYESKNTLGGDVVSWSDVVFGKPPFVMPEGHENPTAENMTWVLWERCKFCFPAGLHILRIRIYETPDSWAEYHE